MNKLASSQPGLPPLDLLRREIAAGKSYWIRLHGSSMLPLFQDGGELYLERINQRNLRLGDIVAVPTPDAENLIVHRIVGLHGPYALIKGDWNRRSDGWLPRDLILGVGRMYREKGKTASLSKTFTRVPLAVASRYNFGVRWVAWILRPLLFA